MPFVGCRLQNSRAKDSCGQLRIFALLVRTVLTYWQTDNVPCAHRFRAICFWIKGSCWTDELDMSRDYLLTRAYKNALKSNHVSCLLGCIGSWQEDMRRRAVLDSIWCILSCNIS